MQVQYADPPRRQKADRLTSVLRAAFWAAVAAVSGLAALLLITLAASH